ncbi:DUF4358 domain-containing protein [Fumia xinanensis]|uniref:DUF4358 domain-containing protein n=1 Tax=Fumia xinanensis TaxID=2763659 RepID=A0A926E2Z4_9FIRM|nr:DUF4358 domain-containing protein [Fumia xinanensis]MBC8558588.1 DUF4358 domain-containing protein [Fumia xinanensis]
MKKIVALLMAALCAVTFVSCNNSSNESGSSNESSGGGAVSSATSSEIFDAINSVFAEKYPDAGAVIPNMPQDVDDTILKDKFGIDVNDVEDYKGQIAGMMTNCDMLLIVKAKDGKIDSVRASLESAKEAQTEQFASYGVMGNIERTAAAKVVTNGNYAALIMVGVLPDDPDAALDFDSDVKLAEDTFNKTIGETK